MNTKKSLNGVRVFLSASVPDELEPYLDKMSLARDLMTLTRRIFSEGGELVFGGHPSITPLLHWSARNLSLGPDVIHLYQLRYFRSKTPREVDDSKVFGRVQWIGEDHTPLDQGLGLMRDAMVAASHAAIFLGGRLASGGICDEYQRFTNHHGRSKPVYLVGCLGGSTRQLINELKDRGENEPNQLAQTERDLVHNSPAMPLVAAAISRDIAKSI
jgi:hypothetical protein